MSGKEKLKATAKNIEGKVEEFVGDITGDKSKEVKGKGKQEAASVKHCVEDTKEKL